MWIAHATKSERSATPAQRSRPTRPTKSNSYSPDASRRSTTRNTSRRTHNKPAATTLATAAPTPAATRTRAEHLAPTGATRFPPCLPAGDLRRRSHVYIVPTGAPMSRFSDTAQPSLATVTTEADPAGPPMVALGPDVHRSLSATAQSKALAGSVFRLYLRPEPGTTLGTWLGRMPSQPQDARTGCRPRRSLGACPQPELGYERGSHLQNQPETTFRARRIAHSTEPRDTNIGCPRNQGIRVGPPTRTWVRAGFAPSERTRTRSEHDPSSGPRSDAT